MKSFIDREKVIKGLEHCANEADCRGCVYQEQMKDRSDGCDCMKEALALLKEKETVKPEVYFVGQDKYKFYRCPVCKTAWYYKGNYCLGCGRAVRWND